MPQMSFRVVMLLVLLAVLSIVLFFLPRDGFTNLDTSAPAPIIDSPPRLYPARNIAVSGPASPAQAAPAEEVRMASPETAYDKFAPNEESAAIPERMRYPERMFQPAPSNATREIAEAAGIASASSSQAAHSMQAFAPEIASNGGEFMNGIFANDSSEPGAYSAF
jgi:hypothetical protein